jgi:hypothetical protein
VGAFNDNLSGAAGGILIDDLRIYGRALSPNEIQVLRKSTPANGGSDAAANRGLSPELPAPVPGVSGRLPANAPTINPDALPDRPTDILQGQRLSRAQIVLNNQGAIAYLTVGTHVTAPMGNVYFKPKLFQWRDSGKRITEVAGVPGQGETVAVAEFAESGISPEEPHLQLGIERQLTRAAGSGERIDLVALPPSAANDRNYFLVTDKKVYARGVPQAAVQIAERALAAGEEVSAAVFPSGDSFAIATTSGIHTANLPHQSNLKSHLEQLHQAGERIEDIVIHPKGFGWSGETGSYAIATNRRIVGVHVSCGSFDRAREWAQQNGVPRQITCDGDRPQVAEEIPPQDIPDLTLGNNQCEWGFRGTVSVHHGLPVLQRELGQSPLAGVEIKVSGATRIGDQWGPWNGWPTVRTDAYGRFAVRQARNCERRRMKLEVKFQSDELEVRHRTSTSSLTKVKWYELDTTIGEGGAIVIDDYELGRPPGTPGLLAGDAAEMWWHADIWVLYSKVIDLMKARGPDFKFTSKVKIKYPHDGIAPDERETSYANPENSVIYITDKGSFENFSVETLLHELGHIWSYQHSASSYNLTSPLGGIQRLSCLTLGFLRNLQFQTHGLVVDRCVAFYEGFAEYFKDHVALALFGDSLQACGANCPPIRPLPFSREYLTFGPWSSNPPQPVTNLELLQRHDMGWYSALHALTDRNRATHVYGSAFSGSTEPDWFVGRDFSSACSNRLGPELDFWDILRAFSPGGGYTSQFRAVRLADERSVPLLADINDTRLDNFLDRVAAVTGEMTAQDVASMRRLIDPAETVEAWDLYCP